MRIAILTSSRADYGIYKPLIRALKEDAFFHVSIIAFGTHLSPFHGHTIDEIINDGFTVDHRISSLLLTDDEQAISTSMGLTMVKFADFWATHATDFDWIFCLGDRFEMFAAVMSGLSFGIRFAHIHGGETTLGAIDNVFRHSITMASQLHFVATPSFAEKVKILIDGNAENIVVSGALSLDNLKGMPLLDKDGFYRKWQIDLSLPSVLITIHPETVTASRNETHLKTILSVLNELREKYQLIITMPNADTNGSLFRLAFHELGMKYPDRIKIIENFGTQSYFSCMKHVLFLLGNTSSGIIEAASLNKFVVNIGDRQKGRLTGENVLHVPFEKNKILSAVAGIESNGVHELENIYFNDGAKDKIIDKLKSLR